MSLQPARIPSKTYTGDGSTLIFAIPFPFLQTKDILVSVNGSNVTTNFTVTGGNGGIGTLTFAGGHAPPNTQAVVITTNYTSDTSNPITRRFQDFGAPIDGPLPSEPFGKTAYQNQQKYLVTTKTAAQAGVAEAVFPTI